MLGQQAKLPTRSRGPGATLSLHQGHTSVIVKLLFSLRSGALSPSQGLLEQAVPSVYLVGRRAG